ncbi:MAG: hypothetical protein HY688_00080, partial [Chloroflexi bacterium]|nr:hypothetical protein [Chloroflexota bacterium]
YNLEDPSGNKEKARQLIARAGYKPGELKVNIVFWKIIELDAPPIIEDLRAVGIQADALIYESTLAYDPWSSGDYDIGVHSFWYVTPDPDEVLYEHFYTGSDRNYNRYSNPEVDRLINQMSVTVDPALRKQRAWDVMEIIMREHAKDIGTFGTFVPVHSVDVHGWSPAPGFSSYTSLRSDHIWLDR